MLAEHTPQELELWSQLQEQVVRKIHESDLALDIEYQDMDGQLTLRRKKPILREVVLSFSSPNQFMNVHYRQDGRPSGLPLMVRVEGNRLINAASDAPLTVDDLVTIVLAFLRERK